MTIFNVFSLFGGLALFLFGMDIMGKALEKQAGGQLQKILSKLTDNPVKGFFLGLCVTAIIQSSSATTVMVVGFVNPLRSVRCWHLSAFCCIWAKTKSARALAPS